MTSIASMQDRQAHAADLLRNAGVLPVITVHTLDEARARGGDRYCGAVVGGHRLGGGVRGAGVGDGTQAHLAQ